jgi:acyl dehydratase
MVEANTQNLDERLYLDDLFVGQRFTSRTHVIDEAQIKAFAQQFDPEPFHQDEDNAKATLFAGLATSGWHTAAITMRLLVDSGLPLAGGARSVAHQMILSPKRMSTAKTSHA